MDISAEAPLLLPLSPRDSLHGIGDDIFTQRYIESASARSSTHGSDGIFDRRSLRSPINGSESEYEDEDDLISEMPLESATPSCYGGDAQDNGEHEFIQYTPSRKQRSPFRNPSSVRGMQLETTPPHLRSPTRESMSKRHQSRLSMGSRTSTPRSVRSHRSGSPSKTIVTPTVKKESPLVLLHVTILPISCPYSQAVLEDVAPPHLLQNWKLLREKVPDTVLERGILIPHPREEYEMLEERLLESLELAVPKILKCGHYHSDQAEDCENEPAHQQLPEESDLANDSDADSDICDDCTRRVRDGTKGSAGTGKRRWNICIYAANGLMRAGAWSAAWKEMERVDVEISPWMDDSLRHELEVRRILEEEDHARRAAEEHEKESMARPSAGLDEERLREIYGTNLPPHHTDRNFTPGDFVAAYEHSPMSPEDEYLAHLASTESTHQLHPQGPAPDEIHLAKRRLTPQQKQQNISTSELLFNYAKLLLRDQRNAALALLSLVVLWLALRSAPLLDISPSLPSVHTVADAKSSIESLVTTASAVSGDALSSGVHSVSSDLASSASSLWSAGVESMPTQLADLVLGSRTESAELVASSA